MTLSGADGETRTEMSRVLHLDGNADADKAFRGLQNAFHGSVAATVQMASGREEIEAGRSEPITFSVANRLFPQSGYPTAAGISRARERILPGAAGVARFSERRSGSDETHQ